MSSYIQQTSNVAADAAQNTAYGAERAKQETNNASGTASATTNAYVDQAKNVVASVANTAQQYAASAGVSALGFEKSGLLTGTSSKRSITP
jgi:hypothetical protein